MKKLLNRTLSVLCAVMLLISAVSAWAAAEEEPATATDLNPSAGEIIPEESGKVPEPEGEDGITSVEVVITKTLTVGQNWDGKMKKTKPAILKLDVTRPGLVYMLVEGKDVWATVQKSDRLTENPSRTKTDPETDRMKSYGSKGGIDYILEHFIPLLRQSGFTEEEITAVTRTNPAQALRIG